MAQRKRLRCPHCRQMNLASDKTCWACGHSLSEEEEAVAQARALLRDRRYREAAEVLRPWLQAHPNDASAWDLLRLVLLEAGLLAPAERAAANVVRLQPTSSTAWFNWGIVLRKLGRTDEARKTLKRALELDPQNEAALAELQELAATDGVHQESLSQPTGSIVAPPGQGPPDAAQPAAPVTPGLPDAARQEERLLPTAPGVPTTDEPSPAPVPAVAAPAHPSGAPRGAVDVAHKTTVWSALAAGFGVTSGCLLAIVLFVVLTIGGCMALLVFSHLATRPPVARQAATPPKRAQYSWEQIEAALSASYSTDLQREEMKKRFRGAWVWMRGRVQNVGTSFDGRLTLSLKCNPLTLTSDTLVFMDPSQKDVLLRYPQGSWITVIAQFSDYGTFGHTYENGRVLR